MQNSMFQSIHTLLTQPSRRRRFWKRASKRYRGYRRRVRHFLAYALTLPPTKLLGMLPASWGRKTGGAIGRFIFRFLPGERKRILKHLKLAYGESMPEEKRLEMCRNILINAGRTMGEWPCLEGGRFEELLANVEMKGMDNLEAALATGNGIICLTAHYGNWELMAPMMPKVMQDREVAVVARDLSNPWINRRTIRMRENGGVRVFPRGSTGRDYIRFLRKGNVLAVLGDMDTDKGSGIFVEYFGRPAWTQSGIARLALLGKAEILPAFIKRDPENPDRHVIDVKPMLQKPDTRQEEEFTRIVTQDFTNAIEDAVRERPEQWMWMHQRWKRQPKGDQN
ncbi:MAG: lysophospholipid acyltransferase family protein [Candidatus Sumerlaeia bacterium]